MTYPTRFAPSHTVEVALLNLQNYAARLDLEENSLTRIKNVHIFNRLLEIDTLVLKQQPVSSGEVVDHAD